MRNSNQPWMPSEFGVIPYRVLVEEERKAFNRTTERG